MKYVYLSIILLALSCGSPKKTSTPKEETRTEENVEAPLAVEDELIVVLKNPKNVANAKALITNSGLTWDKMLFDSETTKIALIKVPADKRDFWLKRLQESGEFKSVELNGIMKTQDVIKREESTFLSFRKTECFGDCPVYDVSVDKEGNVTYNGKKYVVEEGTREFKLTDKEFSALKEKLNKNDFSSYKEVYDNPKIMDLPSTFITHKGKQVQIRLWSDEVPAELIDVHEYLQGLLIDKKFFD
ncbi:hypothetical protein C7447_103440 [Tenacibaculum adriaticum]|uniref:DUF6438 domain-containing protein n=1 Tax=Tenacibaculum adriaticum TaxID=413713 RepID=A0A5S5DUH8_9FLAO|nr:DUF6438 domain-containing protein [Tenacibaculum adriaticum]TYP98269.1 hypothetical protein C7447_103440 [Tenacibaculum adriaticum]